MYIGRLFLIILSPVLLLICPLQQCLIAAENSEITIAAASDLIFALQQITNDFEKKTGIHVKVSAGSSGTFFSQIQNGAPFDVFMSADADYPRKLESAGMVETESLQQYAIGRLVLWLPKTSKLNRNEKVARILKNPEIRKIAIANPLHAPYGRAAVEALKQLKIYEEVNDKLVLGESVSQAAQFVDSGAADAGLIALSLALSPALKDHGDFVSIPIEDSLGLNQTAVILKGARDKKACRAFLSYIQSASAQQVFLKYGFQIPPEKK